MGLILKDLLFEMIGKPPEGATSNYLGVSKDYLSKPYKLPERAVISGKILEITKLTGMPLNEDEKKGMEELRGKDLEFILSLSYAGTNDYLYISTDSWPILRDWGILPKYYYVSVNLIKAAYDGTVVDIYPKRDVQA